MLFLLLTDVYDVYNSCYYVHWFCMWFNFILVCLFSLQSLFVNHLSKQLAKHMTMGKES